MTFTKVSYLTAALALGIASLFAQPVVAQQLTAEQEQNLANIEKLLRRNPDIIPSVAQSLEQFVEQQSAQRKAFNNYYDWLYKNPSHPTLGAADAAHQIVVFTDYNCPYCKKLEPGLEALVKKHPDVQVINVYVPLRQQQVQGLATNSSHFALDIWRSQRSAFTRAHALMMRKSGMHDAQSLRQIAEATDTEQLLQPDPASARVIDSNMKAFQALGLRGTPSILIGQQIIPGYVVEAQLLQAVEQTFGL